VDVCHQVENMWHTVSVKNAVVYSFCSCSSFYYLLISSCIIHKIYKLVVCKDHGKVLVTFFSIDWMKRNTK